MLLQELFLDNNKDLKTVYGVTLNQESSSVEFSSPPADLKEIGFIMDVDEEGLMSEPLMDIVISYRLTNVDVVIEVPYEMILSEKLDPKYLLQLSMNVDFAIAILPSTTEHSSVEYNKVLLMVFDEMLLKPNYDKFVYPISNFLEYLMLEHLLDKEILGNFRPEQKYVLENYASKMTVEESDSFKSLIRQKLYDFYGSKEEFDLVAKTMLESSLEKSESFYKMHVEQQIQLNN